MDSRKRDIHSPRTPIGQVGVKRRRQQESERPRKSARLEQSKQSRLETSSRGGLGTQRSCERPHRQEETTRSVVNASNRKRHRHTSDQAEQNCKRRRKTVGEVVLAPTKAGTSKNEHPIAYWSEHHRWPSHFPESLEEMQNILARKRSVSARSRKDSDSDSASASPTPNSSTLGEPRSREQKSAEYKNPQYQTVLATKGIFMKPSPQGVTDSSKKWPKDLLEMEQTYPQDSLFQDDLFESICESVQNRNETRVIRDIALLIVPSAEVFAIRGASNLQKLNESVNEGWNNSIPITKTRPQPDYAVGFCREAFTQDQLDRMQPVIGDFNDQSYFMATWYMYFPFLTCEVKCGAAALDIADRQNAHSAAIAVRAVVELFRAVKQEKKLHREILAFSISHDHRSVRIYGYYAEIDETEIKYFRHPIRTFDFTEQEGKEKWTVYKFTKNIYDNWMPMHFKRICSAVNEIPADISFSPSLSRPSFSTGLSQDLSGYSIAQSSAGSASAPDQDDTQSSIVADPVTTPSTSVTAEGVFKRPRRGTARRERK